MDEGEIDRSSCRKDSSKELELQTGHFENGTCIVKRSVGAVHVGTIELYILRLYWIFIHWWSVRRIAAACTVIKALFSYTAMQYVIHVTRRRNKICTKIETYFRLTVLNINNYPALHTLVLTLTATEHQKISMNLNGRTCKICILHLRQRKTM